MQGAGFPAPLSTGMAVLAVAMSAAAFFLAPSRVTGSLAGSTTAWKGYRLLLVETGADEGEILARLKAAGIWPVISESTQPVVLSDWSRPVLTTLGAARRTLIRDDPRFDSYIEDLQSYFTARVGDSSYRVIYLPESHSRSSAALSKILSGLSTDYILPESTASSALDFHPFLHFVLAAAVILAAAALDSFLRRSSSAHPERLRLRAKPRAFDSLILRLAVTAPFVVLASKGGWTSFAAALWALALLDAAGAVESFLAEISRGGDYPRALREALRKNPPGIYLFVTAVGASIAQTAILPAAAAALASSSAAVMAFAASAKFFKGRFEPIAILPRRYAPSLADKLRALFACSTIAAAAALASGGMASPAEPPAESDVAAPLPSAISGSTMPLPGEAEKRIPVETVDGRLPGLASWLAHMAVQESIPYARVGEQRGSVFEPVVLPASDGNDTRVVFDDTWARSVYRSIERASIEGMLAAQGRAVTGAIAAVTRNHPASPQNSSPLAPIGALLYILLVIPPLLRIAAGKSMIRAVSSRGIRQEA